MIFLLVISPFLFNSKMVIVVDSPGLIAKLTNVPFGSILGWALNASPLDKTPLKYSFPNVSKV